MPQTYILDTTYYITQLTIMRVRVKMAFGDCVDEWSCTQMDGIHSAILTLIKEYPLIKEDSITPCFDWHCISLSSTLLYYSYFYCRSMYIFFCR